jgi:integrase
VHSDIKAALKSGAWDSKKTRNNHLTIIRGIFGLAVKDRLIKENPCDGLTYERVKKQPPDPFTLSEAKRILESVGKHYSEQILNYLQFKFFSGLRTSECIGLGWKDVDLNAGEILVETVVVYEEEQDSTKTSVSRIVKLTKEAHAALLSQKKYTRTKGGKVFHDPYYNEPWLYHRITRPAFWTTTLKRLGIRHRRCYNTRHTYATIGLMAGVNPAFMAQQLGNGLDVFFKDYAKWIDGKHNDLEMAKLQKAINLEYAQ